MTVAMSVFSLNMITVVLEKMISKIIQSSSTSGIVFLLASDHFVLGEKAYYSSYLVPPCIFVRIDYHCLMDSVLQMQMIHQNKGEGWVKGLAVGSAVYTDRGWEQKCCSCIRKES